MYRFLISCSAAVTALPAGVRICPDFGYSQSSASGSVARGYVDFYIDGSHCIGIELTRDGKLLSQHVARFSPDGIYAPLQLKSWVVVDFRQSVPTASTVEGKPNCIFIILSDHYSTATIKQAGEDDVEFHLRQ